ncbi:hypothetical protein CEE37_14075 [candidate division LCP-89 bacterium B3_LCP]|uniref:Secretion system C-terminal sorting domain-containing protein n=1 Tax=candidate division LCP-89 bacterium B3_LCP TaxID=2012998 RepID=A0A532UQM2_UNCL8|nr:MAG: hypothetical protein CEE37_14075 [candidate division LCP-89 bacterium B3_LCP]
MLQHQDKMAPAINSEPVMKSKIADKGEAMLTETNVIRYLGTVLLTILVSLSITYADDVTNKMELFEKYGHKTYLPTGPTDDPPPQPAKAVAEWEPATGVLICYPLEIPLELVAAMSEVVEVVTFVENEFWMQRAIVDYLSVGVDTSLCMFVFTGDQNLPYTRDFGPWYIFTGDDEQGFINNEYPWPSVNDGDIPIILGDTLGIPVYDTGLLLEGGNYMTDGMGTAITTDYTYLENEPLTPAQIDDIFAEYLGITNHRTVPDPFNYWVPHIDCHAKFLDPGRILVIEPSPVNPIIEENVEYWTTLMSGYGRPYEILRIPGLGYANSLFLNDHVFVALSNSPGDSVALATWQEAMTGYEVTGFTHPGFMFLDALHCRTHEAADRNMLRIVHVPIHDLENTGSGYYLEADIHPYSNEPLIAPPVIMWKTESGSYSPVAMTSAGDDIYYGEIPQQPDDTNIYYYLEAEDGSGRVENHPYIGPGNPHHFYVGPDNEPPVVEFHSPTTLIVPEWPYTFTTYALDNRWISSVTLEHSINGIPQDDVDMPLEEPYAVYYTGTPSSAVQPGDIIELRVKAVDTSVNLNTTYSPYHTITIEGAPAVDVTLTPYNPPIQIPANGGSFDFNIAIANNDPAQQTFDAWIMVQLPNATWYGPVLGPVDLILSSGGTIDRDRTQNVPAGAPAGTYLYAAYIGDYPDIIWTEDQFNFEKLGISDGGLAVNDWLNDGQALEPIAGIKESDKPSDFVLNGAYPNPFNPMTTIHFDLPKASKVTLTVYDISGRLVTELVNGWRDAGEHEVTFDASGMASGIYLVRAHLVNQTTSQKIVLVK